MAEHHTGNISFSQYCAVCRYSHPSNMSHICPGRPQVNTTPTFCVTCATNTLELARLKAENERLERALEEVVNLGSQQAKEWDRFWKAMDVHSADISVDDAIAKYQRLEKQLEIVRSFNSLAFEEWHGRYQDGEFIIFDSDGNGVASGKDALEALAQMEGKSE